MNKSPRYFEGQSSNLIQSKKVSNDLEESEEKMSHEFENSSESPNPIQSQGKKGKSKGSNEEINVLENPALNLEGHMESQGLNGEFEESDVKMMTHRLVKNSQYLDNQDSNLIHSQGDIDKIQELDEKEVQELKSLSLHLESKVLIPIKLQEVNGGLGEANEEIIHQAKNLKSQIPIPTLPQGVIC